MKDYILDIVHLNNDFTGNGMFMALYFITLLFLAFYIKDKRLKRMILYPSLVILIGIYICLPAVNRFVFTVYDDEIRGRFSWLFMAAPIAAMGMTLLVAGLKDKHSQKLLTLALVPVIFLSGVFQITDYRFKKADNLYKLPGVLVEIADTILNEQEGSGDSIAKLVAPYETTYAFRQYNDNIELMFGEDATYGRIWDLRQAAFDSTYACQHLATSCPDLLAVNKAAEHYGMEYLLLDCVYTDFGLESINDDGYLEDENFVGDRTPIDDALSDMKGTVKITSDDAGNPCWDLSNYGLEYMGTFEHYLLYRYN